MKNQGIKKLFSVSIFITFLAALTQTAGAMPHDCPDGGSASIAMALVCSSLAAARKFIR